MSEFKTMLAPETGGLADPRRDPASALSELRIPLLLFGLCLAAQLYLVFSKSFNWDEFLHFSQFYQLQSGTLSHAFQTIHLRMLWWAPEIATNLVGQMLAARIFIWSMHLLTLLMIYGVARQFTNAANSFFAAFAYLGAGYVFTHGFSIRGDPLVTALLMSALFLMARGSLSLLKAILIGVLIGLAGMVTFKAAFYATCFAGLMWFKLNGELKEAAGKLTLLVLSAFLSFAVFYLYHASDLIESAHPIENSSFLSFYARWLNFDFQFAHYIGREIVLAFPFFVSIVLAPRAWKKVGLKADAQIALAGLLAPIAALFFYRNTFPYFFTFILAPVAVAIAPALGLVRDRYGSAFLAMVLSAVPLTLAALEPRDVIVRQRALIDYVHKEFPEKTGYLDYSGMIADYPRILEYLTSGNGMRLYREQGNPIIGREIDRGNVPFIIANQEVIAAALEGQPYPNTLLPTDLAALSGNYVRQWGVLWREGTQVPAGSEAFEFHLRRGGAFVLAGETLTLDGRRVSPGTGVKLDEGRHIISGTRSGSSTLWRGDRLPTDPPDIPMDVVFTNF